ncbi:MAG: Trk system potassium transporter TrkA [Clostridia bacterium]|nr:Trk system potassium transporter TrkA [Clostridia bacterium]
MKIVIVGVGNVGRELLAQLAQEGHDLVCVEQNQTALEKMVNDYDCLGICGNGASYDVLKDAGIETTDLLIACTPQDELNILCCMVAKKLGAKDTIARVHTPEYFTLFKDKDLGLSMMVNPEYETALSIARILKYSSALKIETFANGKVDIVEVKVSSDSKLKDVALKNLSNVIKTKVLVCAVERDGAIFIPSGDFVLKENDRIFITASAKSIAEFFGEIKGDKQTHNCIIIGGNGVAFYLAKELQKVGTKVKIIEQDKEQCLKLADALQNVEIIEGDPTDHELLLDEGLSMTDALICLSSIDEQNVLISTFANSIGVKKVVTRVEKRPYYNMLKSSNIDTVISGKSTTAEHIVRYARGKQNLQNPVARLYKIADEQAEALEFIINKNFKALNVPLKDVKFKPNTLIGAIIRQGEVIFPSGNESIQLNDSVVVVYAGKNADDINQFLE